MEISVGNVPLEIAEDLIDCEDFVRKVVEIAPDSITMNKDARVVFNFTKKQEREIGEALATYPLIRAGGVNKPSLLGASLTRMYARLLLDQVNDVVHNDQDASDLMFGKRLEEVAKKKGFESTDAWIERD
jgi:hypothetical protein